MSDQAGPVEFIPAGRILADGLRVLDRLGSTPDGQLYNAEYSNGVEVTLAILHPEPVGGESSTREWFGRATQIQHPNVAAVFRGLEPLVISLSMLPMQDQAAVEALAGRNVVPAAQRGGTC